MNQARTRETVRQGVLAIATLALPACSLLPQAPMSLPAPLSPASLGQTRTVRQIVHAAYADHEATMQCVLSVDADRLRLIALGALGNRLFTLSHDGERSSLESVPPVPADLPPERLLDDIQFALWPLPALQARLAGSDWQLSEPTPGTRRLRFGGRLIAEVHYAGPDPWNGRLWLSNFQIGYTLTVDSAPLQPP
ncbi:MAG: DUF3261 domain-containing protein [Panacagrimonas sp.]